VEQPLSQATRTLFLAFIKRVGPEKFPRPLAISKISQLIYACLVNPPTQRTLGCLRRSGTLLGAGGREAPPL
jgi:hypothetical protein